jgi:hypothetical protein
MLMARLAVRRGEIQAGGKSQTVGPQMIAKFLQRTRFTGFMVMNCSYPLLNVFLKLYTNKPNWRAPPCRYRDGIREFHETIVNMFM